MANTVEDVRRLEKEFKACRKILTALGDDTRQHLLCIMLRCECGGSRVIDIAEQTNLSRPAVSHHMQILKDAGVVKSRKEGDLHLLLFRPGGKPDQRSDHPVLRYPGVYEGGPGQERRRRVRRALSRRERVANGHVPPHVPPSEARTEISCRESESGCCNSIERSGGISNGSITGDEPAALGPFLHGAAH